MSQLAYNRQKWAQMVNEMKSEDMDLIYLGVEGDQWQIFFMHVHQQ